MKYLTVIKELAITIFFGLLVVILMLTIPIVRRLDTASHQLLDCTWKDSSGKMRSNPTCLQSSIMAIQGSVRVSAGAVAKAAPEIASSIAIATANSARASAETVTLAQTGTSLLTKAGTLTDGVGGIVKSGQIAMDTSRLAFAELYAGIKTITADTVTLLESSDATIRGAGESLARLNELEDVLNKQVSEGAPEVLGTLKAMRKVAEAPALINTLNNLDHGTGSAAGTAKDVEIIVSDIRRRHQRIVAIIRAITFGLIK